MPLPDYDADAALNRLFTVARRGTGQSRHVSNFLLAWWNASQNGGWDPTDLWAIDRDIKDDILTLISYMGRHKEYPDSYQPEFRALVDMWRAEAQPSP